MRYLHDHEEMGTRTLVLRMDFGEGIGCSFLCLVSIIGALRFPGQPGENWKIGENWCYGFVFCIAVLTVRGRQVGADEGGHRKALYIAGYVLCLSRSCMVVVFVLLFGLVWFSLVWPLLVIDYLYRYFFFLIPDALGHWLPRNDSLVFRLFCQ